MSFWISIYRLGTDFGLLKEIKEKDPALPVILLTANVNVPDYKFDIPMFFITLGIFTIVYEGIMLIYGHYMKKISLKHIMSE